MGLVNTVVPYEQLEDETVQWCEEMLANEPNSTSFLKAAMNADTDGLAGFNNWLEMLHFFITQRMKRKKAAMRLKKNVNRTSVNSHVSLKETDRHMQSCLLLSGSFF